MSDPAPRTPVIAVVIATLVIVGGAFLLDDEGGPDPVEPTPGVVSGFEGDPTLPDPGGVTPEAPTDPGVRFERQLDLALGPVIDAQTELSELAAAWRQSVASDAEFAAALTQERDVFVESITLLGSLAPPIDEPDALLHAGRSVELQLVSLDVHLAATAVDDADEADELDLIARRLRIISEAVSSGSTTVNLGDLGEPGSPDDLIRREAFALGVLGFDDLAATLIAE